MKINSNSNNNVDSIDNYSGKNIEDDSSSLWRDKVEYVDLSSSITTTEITKNSRSLPLFLLVGGNAFYPLGTTYLNIFEMKYRTMMFDISNSDDTFGYIHTNPSTGQIAKVGTLCKVTDRQLLDDGRQFIALEGVSRFTVTKLVKTLPYIVADVELNLIDDAVDEAQAKVLEQEVYSALKYYMRLMKTAESNKAMVVSQSTRKTRPQSSMEGWSGVDESSRRTEFSFSLANMIQMSQTRESQLLLQTTSIMKRLKVEREILVQAAEMIAEQLIKMNLITEEVKQDIKRQAYSVGDNDDDILPKEYIEEAKVVEKDEWDLSNIE